MNDSFYITLSSNVDEKFFPDNTLTHFLNKLPSPLDLNNGEWEVGLVELQCPFNWYNVKEEEISVTFIFPLHYYLNETPSSASVVSVPTGYYKNPRNIIHELNRGIDNLRNENFKGALSFQYNSISHKVGVKKINPDIFAIFSDKLSRILGFKKVDPDWKDVLYADDITDLDDGLHHLFIYTNIVEHRSVGHTLVPLLRILPIPKMKQTMNHVFTFQNIHYLPVRRSIYDSLEIDIRSITGAAVPFQRGQVLVTLHIRRKQS